MRDVVISAGEVKNSPVKNQNDNWSYEFYKELLHEIDSIHEEDTDHENDDYQTQTSIQVDPLLVQASIEVRKRHRLFNRTARKIIATTRNKQFRAAELLRGHLFNINPKASSLIYKIGQFIEREKRKHEHSGMSDPITREDKPTGIAQNITEQAPVKQSKPVKKSTGDTRKSVTAKQRTSSVEIEFMGCWFDLYLNMTGYECVSFRALLKKQIFDTKHRIIEQQKPAGRLYFFNSGTALITERINGKSKYVKTLKSGDIAGAKSFFNGKASNTSVTAEPGAVVEFIEKEDLNELKIKHPELVGKLQIYCQLKN